MASEERGTFGLVGKAWETAKIYNGSNIVKYHDAIVESDTLKTLGEFVREPQNMIETRGIDFDEKASDNLARYNIVKITPTRRLGEVENFNEMFLITDEHGHDIGTYEITENGPRFHLSPKIKAYNDKMIREGGFSEKGQEILEKEYGVKTLEKAVEKLAKGEDLLIESKEKANSVIREGIKAEYMQNGMEVEDNEQELSPEEEQERAVQRKVLARVPADMRDEVYSLINEKGVKVKEVLIVDNPKQIASRIDNRKNQIKENGGPVVLVKTVHGGADNIGDDVYTIQDGQTAIQDEKNDMILENIMDNHKDETHVRDLDSDDNNVVSDRDAEEIIKINAEKAARAQAIIHQSELEIKSEEAAIQSLLETYMTSDEQGKEEILKQIEGHKETISKIYTERDIALSSLMDRDPEYKLDESERAKELEEIPVPEETEEPEEKEETDDEEPEKNRWEEADPYNQHKNG